MRKIISHSELIYLMDIRKQPNNAYYVLYYSGLIFIYWVNLQVLFNAIRACANMPVLLITITIERE